MADSVQGGVDREQVRLKAKERERGGFFDVTLPTGEVLILLAELEQAEKWANTMEHERDWETQVVHSELLARAEAAEARLAKVPALVEALTNWFEDADTAKSFDLTHHELALRLGEMFFGYGGEHNHEDDLREALAEWERG